ncbi:histidine kinase dimerization/phospho-acceptor domain-containing protein [Sphingomonas astaxanthinifaciens]|uniref:histidine kinase dimerization/phospho-acceptor domain-containing protein n=1 Tax=Sphingomonas astaxanthinifaciens TaxID=407019 RepID=UPI0004A7515E|nr:histidine kinase dimerization/phospho-acceptor domain-containing protein [Sphingomonas astaxanthinifaciens]
MRFDDRLATVLDQPAADARGRAVQWRQLVELVARGGEGGSEVRDRALERIARLMSELPVETLAATARAIAGPQVPVELVALFAARGAAASAALIAAADLDTAGWSAVRAVAADDVQPLLNAIHPAAAPASAPVPPPPAASAPPPEPATSDPPPAPPPAGLFRWECGPTGEIDWVEGAPRAALIGRSLTEPFADRFAARLPFADEALVLADEGAIAGEWRWSGTPAFFPDTGRFAGYRGFARREGIVPEDAEPAAPPLPQDDDLRELMHELRTPLNAIIGFGEIIEGQYLGPAHRSYRERAGEIVRQARRLADAVDNLDLAARLRSGRAQGETLVAVDRMRELAGDLQEEAQARGIQLMVQDHAGAGALALQPILAERLTRQFAGAILETAVAGERLSLVIDRLGGQLAIGLDRPRAIQALSERRLFDDRGQTGTRFALRLVQGLAAMVGGRLDIAPDRLVLLLPLTR